MFFVLGGEDAEMSTIKSLLQMQGVPFVQPNKGWGNHIYSPADVGLTPVEIIAGETYFRNVHEEHRITVLQDRTGNQAMKVVFVECQPNEEWPLGLCTMVDHHGDNSHEPASILQVYNLLERPSVSDATRRWFELIAANDAGYIPAMVAIGATPEEVVRVRSYDRACQGITPDQEKLAEYAVRERQVDGRLTIVHLAHAKCATVTDRLSSETGGDGYDQLLIHSRDGESNFYGDGALCVILKDRFGGWNGGSGLGLLGGTAFWGGNAPQGEVTDYILAFLSGHSN